MPRRERKRNIKKRTPRRRRRAQEPRLLSSVITTLTLKSNHNKEEVYPIPISDLVSRANIGSDADILARSYSMRIDFASGNNMNTVSVNLGHSGDWVRRGTSVDAYNQQFRDRRVSYKGTVNFKKSLQESERQFVNPDIAANLINLRVRDPCGVLPGVTIKITCTFLFVRRAISTTFMGASDPARDLYADQDVNSGAPQPPVALQDIPFRIIDFTEGAISTRSTSSPYRYVAGGPSNRSYTITVAGTVNKIGEFTTLQGESQSTLQSRYTAAGFEGNIHRTP